MSKQISSLQKLLTTSSLLALNLFANSAQATSTTIFDSAQDSYSAHWDTNIAPPANSNLIVSKKGIIFDGINAAYKSLEFNAGLSGAFIDFRRSISLESLVGNNNLIILTSGVYTLLDVQNIYTSTLRMQDPDTSLRFSSLSGSAIQASDYGMGTLEFVGGKDYTNFQIGANGTPVYKTSWNTGNINLSNASIYSVSLFAQSSSGSSIGITGDTTLSVEDAGKYNSFKINISPVVNLTLNGGHYYNVNIDSNPGGGNLRFEGAVTTDGTIGAINGMGCVTLLNNANVIAQNEISTTLLEFNNNATLNYNNASIRIPQITFLGSASTLNFNLGGSIEGPGGGVVAINDLNNSSTLYLGGNTLINGAIKNLGNLVIQDGATLSLSSSTIEVSALSGNATIRTDATPTTFIGSFGSKVNTINSMLIGGNITIGGLHGEDVFSLYADSFGSTEAIRRTVTVQNNSLLKINSSDNNYVVNDNQEFTLLGGSYTGTFNSNTAYNGTLNIYDEVSFSGAVGRTSPFHYVNIAADAVMTVSGGLRASQTTFDSGSTLQLNSNDFYGALIFKGQSGILNVGVDGVTLPSIVGAGNATINFAYDGTMQGDIGLGKLVVSSGKTVTLSGATGNYYTILDTNGAGSIFIDNPGSSIVGSSIGSEGVNRLNALIFSGDATFNSVSLYKNTLEKKIGDVLITVTGDSNINLNSSNVNFAIADGATLQMSNALSYGKIDSVNPGGGYLRISGAGNVDKPIGTNVKLGKVQFDASNVTVSSIINTNHYVIGTGVTLNLGDNNLNATSDVNLDAAEITAPNIVASGGVKFNVVANSTLRINGNASGDFAISLGSLTLEGGKYTGNIYDVYNSRTLRINGETTFEEKVGDLGQISNVTISNNATATMYKGLDAGMINFGQNSILSIGVDGFSAQANLQNNVARIALQGGMLNFSGLSNSENGIITMAQNSTILGGIASIDRFEVADNTIMVFNDANTYNLGNVSGYASFLTNLSGVTLSGTYGTNLTKIKSFKLGNQANFNSLQLNTDTFDANGKNISIIGDSLINADSNVIGNFTIYSGQTLSLSSGNFTSSIDSNIANKGTLSIIGNVSIANSFIGQTVRLGVYNAQSEHVLDTTSISVEEMTGGATIAISGGTHIDTLQSSNNFLLNDASDLYLINGTYSGNFSAAGYQSGTLRIENGGTFSGTFGTESNKIAQVYLSAGKNTEFLGAFYAGAVYLDNNSEVTFRSNSLNAGLFFSNLNGVVNVLGEDAAFSSVHNSANATINFANSASISGDLSLYSLGTAVDKLITLSGTNPYYSIKNTTGAGSILVFGSKSTFTNSNLGSDGINRLGIVTFEESGTLANVNLYADSLQGTLDDVTITIGGTTNLNVNSTSVDIAIDDGATLQVSAGFPAGEVNSVNPGGGYLRISRNGPIDTAIGNNVKLGKVIIDENRKVTFTKSVNTDHYALGATAKLVLLVSDFYANEDSDLNGVEVTAPNIITNGDITFNVLANSTLRITGSTAGGNYNIKNGTLAVEGGEYTGHIYDDTHSNGLTVSGTITFSEKVGDTGKIGTLTLTNGATATMLNGLNANAVKLDANTILTVGVDDFASQVDFRNSNAILSLQGGTLDFTGLSNGDSGTITLGKSATIIGGISSLSQLTASNNSTVIFSDADTYNIQNLSGYTYILTNVSGITLSGTFGSNASKIQSFKLGNNATFAGLIVNAETFDPNGKDINITDDSTINSGSNLSIGMLGIDIGKTLSIVGSGGNAYTIDSTVGNGSIVIDNPGSTLLNSNIGTAVQDIIMSLTLTGDTTFNNVNLNITALAKQTNTPQINVIGDSSVTLSMSDANFAIQNNVLLTLNGGFHSGMIDSMVGDTGNLQLSLGVIFNSAVGATHKLGNVTILDSALVNAIHGLYANNVAIGKNVALTLGSHPLYLDVDSEFNNVSVQASSILATSGVPTIKAEDSTVAITRDKDDNPGTVEVNFTVSDSKTLILLGGDYKGKVNSDLSAKANLELMDKVIFSESVGGETQFENIKILDNANVVAKKGLYASDISFGSTITLDVGETEITISQDKELNNVNVTAGGINVVGVSTPRISIAGDSVFNILGIARGDWLINSNVALTLQGGTYANTINASPGASAARLILGEQVALYQIIGNTNPISSIEIQDDANVTSMGTIRADNLIVGDNASLTTQGNLMAQKIDFQNKHNTITFDADSSLTSDLFSNSKYTTINFNRAGIISGGFSGLYALGIQQGGVVSFSDDSVYSVSKTTGTGSVRTSTAGVTLSGQYGDQTTNLLTSLRFGANVKLDNVHIYTAELASNAGVVAVVSGESGIYIPSISPTSVQFSLAPDSVFTVYGGEFTGSIDGAEEFAGTIKFSGQVNVSEIGKNQPLSQVILDTPTIVLQSGVIAAQHITNQKDIQTYGESAISISGNSAANYLVSAGGSLEINGGSHSGRIYPTINNTGSLTVSGNTNLTNTQSGNYFSSLIISDESTATISRIGSAATTSLGQNAKLIYGGSTYPLTINFQNFANEASFTNLDTPATLSISNAGSATINLSNDASFAGSISSLAALNTQPYKVITLGTEDASYTINSTTGASIFVVGNGVTLSGSLGGDGNDRLTNITLGKDINLSGTNIVSSGLSSDYSIIVSGNSTFDIKSADSGSFLIDNNVTLTLAGGVYSTQIDAVISDVGSLRITGQNVRLNSAVGSIKRLDSLSIGGTVTANNNLTAKNIYFSDGGELDLQLFRLRGGVDFQNSNGIIRITGDNGRIQGAILNGDNATIYVSAEANLGDGDVKLGNLTVTDTNIVHLRGAYKFDIASTIGAPNLVVENSGATLSGNFGRNSEGNRITGLSINKITNFDGLNLIANEITSVEGGSITVIGDSSIYVTDKIHSAISIQEGKNLSIASGSIYGGIDGPGRLLILGQVTFNEAVGTTTRVSEILAASDFTIDTPIFNVGTVSNNETIRTIDVAQNLHLSVTNSFYNTLRLSEDVTLRLAQGNYYQIISTKDDSGCLTIMEGGVVTISGEVGKLEKVELLQDSSLTTGSTIGATHILLGSGSILEYTSATSIGKIDFQGNAATVTLGSVVFNVSQFLNAGAGTLRLNGDSSITGDVTGLAVNLSGNASLKIVDGGINSNVTGSGTLSIYSQNRTIKGKFGTNENNLTAINFGGDVSIDGAEIHAKNITSIDGLFVAHITNNTAITLTGNAAAHFNIHENVSLSLNGGTYNSIDGAGTVIVEGPNTVLTANIGKNLPPMIELHNSVSVADATIVATAITSILDTQYIYVTGDTTISAEVNPTIIITNDKALTLDGGKYVNIATDNDNHGVLNIQNNVAVRGVIGSKVSSLRQIELSDDASLTVGGNIYATRMLVGSGSMLDLDVFEFNGILDFQDKDGLVSITTLALDNATYTNAASATIRVMAQPGYNGEINLTDSLGTLEVNGRLALSSIGEEAKIGNITISTSSALTLQSSFLIENLVMGQDSALFIGPNRISGTIDFADQNGTVIIEESEINNVTFKNASNALISITRGGEIIGNLEWHGRLVFSEGESLTLDGSDIYIDETSGSGSVEIKNENATLRGTLGQGGSHIKSLTLDHDVTFDNFTLFSESVGGNNDASITVKGENKIYTAGVLNNNIFIDSDATITFYATEVSSQIRGTTDGAGTIIVPDSWSQIFTAKIGGSFAEQSRNLSQIVIGSAAVVTANSGVHVGELLFNGSAAQFNIGNGTFTGAINFNSQSGTFIVGDGEIILTGDGMQSGENSVLRFEGNGSISGGNVSIASIQILNDRTASLNGPYNFSVNRALGSGSFQTDSDNVTLSGIFGDDALNRLNSVSLGGTTTFDGVALYAHELVNDHAIYITKDSKLNILNGPISSPFIISEDASLAIEKEAKYTGQIIGAGAGVGTIIIHPGLNVTFAGQIGGTVMEENRNLAKVYLSGSTLTMLNDISVRSLFFPIGGGVFDLGNNSFTGTVDFGSSTSIFKVANGTINFSDNAITDGQNASIGILGAATINGGDLSINQISFAGDSSLRLDSGRYYDVVNTFGIGSIILQNGTSLVGNFGRNEPEHRLGTITVDNSIFGHDFDTYINGATIYASRISEGNVQIIGTVSLNISDAVPTSFEITQNGNLRLGSGTYSGSIKSTQAHSGYVSVLNSEVTVSSSIGAKNNEIATLSIDNANLTAENGIYADHITFSSTGVLNVSGPVSTNEIGFGDEATINVTKATMSGVKVSGRTDLATFNINSSEIGLEPKDIRTVNATLNFIGDGTLRGSAIYDIVNIANNSVVTLSNSQRFEIVNLTGDGTVNVAETVDAIVGQFGSDKTTLPLLQIFDDVKLGDGLGAGITIYADKFNYFGEVIRTATVSSSSVLYINEFNNNLLINEDVSLDVHGGVYSAMVDSATEKGGKLNIYDQTLIPTIGNIHNIQALDVKDDAKLSAVNIKAKNISLGKNSTITLGSSAVFNDLGSSESSSSLKMLNGSSLSGGSDYFAGQLSIYGDASIQGEYHIANTELQINKLTIEDGGFLDTHATGSGTIFIAGSGRLAGIYGQEDSNLGDVQINGALNLGFDDGISKKDATFYIDRITSADEDQKNINIYSTVNLTVAFDVNQALSLHKYANLQLSGENNYEKIEIVGETAAIRLTGVQVNNLELNDNSGWISLNGGRINRTLTQSGNSTISLESNSTIYSGIASIKTISLGTYNLTLGDGLYNISNTTGNGSIDVARRDAVISGAIGTDDANNRLTKFLTLDDTKFNNLNLVTDKLENLDGQIIIEDNSSITLNESTLVPFAINAGKKLTLNRGSYFGPIRGQNSQLELGAAIIRGSIGSNDGVLEAIDVTGESKVSGEVYAKDIFVHNEASIDITNAIINSRIELLSAKSKLIMQNSTNTNPIIPSENNLGIVQIRAGNLTSDIGSETHRLLTVETGAALDVSSNGHNLYARDLSVQNNNFLITEASRLVAGHVTIEQGGTITATGQINASISGQGRLVLNSVQQGENFSVSQLDSVEFNTNYDINKPITASTVSVGRNVSIGSSGMLIADNLNIDGSLTYEAGSLDAKNITGGGTFNLKRHFDLSKIGTELRNLGVLRLSGDAVSYDAPSTIRASATIIEEGCGLILSNDTTLNGNLTTNPNTAITIEDKELTINGPLTIENGPLDIHTKINAIDQFGRISAQSIKTNSNIINLVIDASSFTDTQDREFPMLLNIDRVDKVNLSTNNRIFSFNIDQRGVVSTSIDQEEVDNRGNEIKEVVSKVAKVPEYVKEFISELKAQSDEAQNLAMAVLRLDTVKDKAIIQDIIVRSMDNNTDTAQEVLDVQGDENNDVIIKNIVGQFRPIVSSSGASVSSGSEDRIRDAGVWVEAFGEKATQKLHKISPGYKATSVGAIIGADGLVTDDLRLGFAVANAQSDVKLKDHKKGDKIKFYMWDFNIHGSYDFTPNIYGAAIISYATGKVNHRDIKPVPGGGKTTSYGEYKTHQYSLDAVVGYKKHLVNNIIFTPEVGFKALTRKNSDYLEHGGYTNRYVHQNGRANSYKVAFAGYLGKEISVKDHSILPEIYTKVIRQISGNNPTISSTITGAASSQISRADPQNKTSYVFGANIGVNGKMFDYSIGYEAKISKKYQAHGGSLRVRVNL